jgi:hypothetical protein
MARPTVHRPPARPLAATGRRAARLLATALGLTLVACTVRLDLPGDLPEDALPSRDAGQHPDGAADVVVPRDGPDGGPARPEAGPEVVPPPPDTGLPPRDVLSPRDTPPSPDIPDGAPVDGGPHTDGQADLDALPAPDLPVLRYCPWDLEALPLLQRSRLFTAEDFSGTTSSPTPIDRACGSGLFPDRDRPERVFAFYPDGPARLVVRSRCAGWDCDAVLVDGDCLLSNVEVCAAAEGELRIDAEVDAGLWLLQVEARTGFEPGVFDLLVALDYEAGRDPCPAVGEVRLSELAAVGVCALDAAGRGVRRLLLTGDTGAPGARDDVFVDCRGAGIDRDDTGGAPDRIWRVVGDAPDGVARLLSAEVVAEGGAWQPVLALTGPPCGAADRVIDCDRARDGSAAVEDVTIFYGEELYVVVDGVGERMLDGEPAAGPFTLTLSVEDPACDPPPEER